MMSEDDDEGLRTEDDTADDITHVGVPPAPKMPSFSETLPGGITPTNEDVDENDDAEQAHDSDAIVFRMFGKTDVGLSREHNEDNFLVADLGQTELSNITDRVVEGRVDGRGIAMAVCDGMGGAAAGEVASQMAVDVLLEELGGEARAGDRDAFARRLVRAVETAGSRIFDSAKRDRERCGMGTTATVAGADRQGSFCRAGGRQPLLCVPKWQAKFADQRSVAGQSIDRGRGSLPKKRPRRSSIPISSYRPSERPKG